MILKCCLISKFSFNAFKFITGLLAIQRFEQQPSYTEVNPGQDALLVCKIFNKRGSCSWQKDNKVGKTFSR